MAGPERIWYEDPAGLFAGERYLAVIPTSAMSFAQQLNALLRLALYYAAAVAVIRLRPESFVVPVGTALLSYLVFSGRGPGAGGLSWGLGGGEGEPFGGGEGAAEACSTPTRHNPYMNQLPLDEDNNDRPACDPLTPGVKRKMREKFQRDLYRDTGDLFERGNSERQFFTMPSNQPEDQTAFAEWIYGDSRRGGKATRPPAPPPPGSRECTQAP